MKKQVEEWIRFAEKDLLAVLEIMKNSHLANIATFHCQQAIEKYFKAFLLEHEKPLNRTHNLLTLYGTIKEIIDFGFDEDLLSIINDIYLDSRYPGETGLLDDGSMPTVEQVNQFYFFAKDVETRIRNELNNESI